MSAHSNIYQPDCKCHTVAWAIWSSRSCTNMWSQRHNQLLANATTADEQSKTNTCLVADTDEKTITLETSDTRYIPLPQIHDLGDRHSLSRWSQHASYHMRCRHGDQLPLQCCPSMQASHIQNQTCALICSKRVPVIAVLNTYAAE